MVFKKVDPIFDFGVAFQAWCWWIIDKAVDACSRYYRRRFRTRCLYFASVLPAMSQQRRAMPCSLAQML